MNNPQIPIYRAKKVDSDEYVEGFYMQVKPSYQYDGTINGKKIKDWEYLILTESGIEYPYDVDPTTLSIHFPDMLDSQGNKIFASLSAGGKGGDILECESHYQGINATETAVYSRKRFYPFLTVVNFENKPYKDYYSEFKAIGIQE